MATLSSVEQLSQLDRSEFSDHLAGIFEHTPWVAERAWEQRPFQSTRDLHRAMVEAVNNASKAEQLALIRAHPELAGKEAASGTLTPASTTEQQGAGLDQCSTSELARLQQLNASYLARFEFPFVIAVKGLSRYQIMDAMEARLKNDTDAEFQTCLGEIGKIARFRLDMLLR